MTDPDATASADDPAPAPPPPPDPSGFDLLGEVGSGGMGAVFRARDRELNREVAVKVLHEKYRPQSVTGKRFVAEAHVTAQLQHPGLPPVYRVGTLPDGRPFLAMKLIKGQTLADLLASREGERPEFGRWLGVFEAICQAVGYAHAHGVVHRDLKPANVMVGAFGEVQVMDWGLAKVLPASGGRQPPGDPTDPDATRDPDPTAINSARDSDLLTQYGSILGTPAFMAPEQAIGAVDKIDRRTDVFGLGAILCVLLTGKPPYVGDTALSTRELAARAKLDDCFTRLDASGAEPGLVSLCKWCLSEEPADRPADATVVAKAVAGLRNAVAERARNTETEATARWTEQRTAWRVWRAATVGILATLIAYANGEYNLFRSHGDQEYTRRLWAEHRDAKDVLIRHQAESEEMVEQLLGVKKPLPSDELIEAQRRRWKRIAELEIGSIPRYRMVLTGHRHLGDLLARLGRWDEVVGEYLAARQIAVSLYRYWQVSAQEVTDCHTTLAEAFDRVGRKADAELERRAAQELVKKR